MISYTQTAALEGKYSLRFVFFCNAALQDPVSAAAETKRCVKQLGGVGVMIGGYSNNGSVNNVIYLDDPSNDCLWEKVEELEVPLYLHPRMPPPDQQLVYEGYGFLAGSPWGFSSEMAAQALRLMVSGLFDRYPKLQIILGHC
jgi:2,3-dihydroxybenzoate decarboxylase